MGYKKDGGLLAIKGLDTSKPAEYLKPENTPNCQNIRVNRDILRKREGATILGPIDQIDEYDVLVVQGQGTDGLNAFLDSSFVPATITPQGDVQFDNAASQFWTTSILFDGTGDYYTVPDAAKWFFGTGAFTIRGRFRFADLTGVQVICGQYVDANNYWKLTKEAASGGQYRLKFKAVSGGVTVGDYQSALMTLAINTWYLFEMSRNGAFCYMFRNGTSLTVTETTAWGTLTDLASVLYVGQNGNSGEYFNGWHNDLVISKGISRHQSSYTDPGVAYKGHAFNEPVMAGEYLLREAVGYNVRVGPTKIQKYNTTTQVWENIHGTLLAATSSDPVDVATPLLSGKRILCVTNFVDNIRKYTGTGNTADLGGSPPKAKFMSEYTDYLVLGYINSGGNTFPTRVQWPDTANPENWSTGNAGSKDLNDDNDDLTAVALFGEYVTAHKRSSIYLGYRVTTSSVFKFDRVNTGSGAINHATIQNLPTGQLAFLAIDGIRLFNGTSAPIIEGPVTDEIRETMNPEYVKRAWSLVVKELDEYWCGVPLGSSQVGDTVYKYNYRTGVVHKDTRANTISAWKYINDTVLTWDDIAASWDAYPDRWDANSLGVKSEIPLLGDTNGETKYRDITVNNDDLVAIDAFWESKDFEADEKGRLGRWLQMEVWAKGQNVTIEYSIDGGITWVGQQTIALDSDYPMDASPDIYYLDVVSTRIRFRFKNNTASETFSLKQFVISYSNRESRT